MKIGETKPAGGLISLKEFDASCTTGVHLETLRASSPAPTITRTGPDDVESGCAERGV
jgi:hypothetical protein